MKLDFQGRKIIVTGAATGIGRATAEALIAAGASVALWDIDQAACAAFSEKTNAKSYIKGYSKKIRSIYFNSIEGTKRLSRCKLDY